MIRRKGAERLIKVYNHKINAISMHLPRLMPFIAAILSEYFAFLFYCLKEMKSTIEERVFESNVKFGETIWLLHRFAPRHFY